MKQDQKQEGNMELNDAIVRANKFIGKLSKTTPANRDEWLQLLSECNSVVSPFTASWGRDQRTANKHRARISVSYGAMCKRAEKRGLRP